MSQLVYAENSVGRRSYDRAQSPLAPSSLAGFRLQPLTVLRASKPERVLAIALILTLHAVVLTLLAQSPVQPITLPAQPQPISVELVAAAPVAQPTPEIQPDPVEATLSDAISSPLEPVEEVKPQDDNALKPAPPEKKEPPVVKKVAVAKPVAPPRPAPPLAAAPSVSAPSTVSAPQSKMAAEAPLSAPLANADYLHNPPPPYPDVAISRGQEGTVLLNVQVRPDGTVQTLNIQKSSGHPALDNAARDTVLRWSFVPARRGNQAVSGWVIVPVDFSLAS